MLAAPIIKEKAAGDCKGRGGNAMFALIYDDHDPGKPSKEVLSVHRSRRTAEKALDARRASLKRSIAQCNTRIVWTDRPVHAGDRLTVHEFESWAPGERIPSGELFSDTD